MLFPTLLLGVSFLPKFEMADLIVFLPKWKNKWSRKFSVTRINWKKGQLQVVDQNVLDQCCPIIFFWIENNYCRFLALREHPICLLETPAFLFWGRYNLVYLAMQRGNVKRMSFVKIYDLHLFCFLQPLKVDFDKETIVQPIGKF